MGIGAGDQVNGKAREQVESAAGEPDQRARGRAALARGKAEQVPGHAGEAVVLVTEAAKDLSR